MYKTWRYFFTHFTTIFLHVQKIMKNYICQLFYSILKRVRAYTGKGCE